VDFVKFIFIKALLNGVTLFKCYTGVIWSIPIIKCNNQNCFFIKLMIFLGYYNKPVNIIHLINLS
jgi:hypothetical protein